MTPFDSPPIGTPEYQKFLLGAKMEQGLTPCGSGGKLMSETAVKRHIESCPLPPCTAAKKIISEYTKEQPVDTASDDEFDWPTEL